MKTYTYQNTLIGKKQLRQLLAWSFTNYDSMQACLLADELKYLGFKYASQAGISISIEDLRIPFVKSLMIEKANSEIHNSEKIFLKGKITNVERFQKIIDTWSLTSESLKNQIIYYFKNYDPLNSVYIMAFSGARGNLSQVRQLVGMRGLMSDPSGQIMNLPIKKNFREGLTITDYLMSGYGARKGIVDTALKTANSGYLTRRLIDVSQDIIIREKDCFSNYSFLFSNKSFSNSNVIYNKILGRVLAKPVLNYKTSNLIVQKNTQVTPELIEKFKEKNIDKFSIRSPLTCQLYRSICQKCYGWDLSTENLVDIGEAIGILAGQSIGEPGTQLTMRTFHTGGIFTSEARQQIISPINGVIQFYRHLKTVVLRTNRGEDVLVAKNSGSLVIIPKNKMEDLIKIPISRNTILFPKNNQYICKDIVIGEIINTNKQVKTEIKPILSDACGEIFIPKLKQKINVINNNQLIWILSGQLYNSPRNSFLNFYSDYKLNQFNYIFRTKVINHYKGIVRFVNNKESLYQGFVKLLNHKYSLTNSKLEQLNSSNHSKKFILTFNKLKYFVTIEKQYSTNYIQVTRNEKFGSLITNSFLTHTGGTTFRRFRDNLASENVIFFSPLQLPLKRVYYWIEYNYPIFKELERVRQQIDKNIEKIKEKYPSNLELTLNTKTPPSKKLVKKLIRLKKKLEKLEYKLKKIKRIKKNFINWFLSEPPLKKRAKYGLKKLQLRPYKNIIWLGEESHRIKCEATDLLVKDGDFISNGFEFITDHFAKTSGYITINSIINKKEKNQGKIQLVSIKSGLIYKSKKQKKIEKKVYYPGEVLLSNVSIPTLSLCQSIEPKNNGSILIRPLQIYELPLLVSHPLNGIQTNLTQFDLNFVSSYVCRYKSNQVIYGQRNVNLVDNLLFFKTKNFFKKNIHITLLNNFSKNSVEFSFIEKLNLNNYITPQLRNQNIQPCFLVQNNQFISNYNILGYLETLTLNSLEIVKFKVKQQNEKQIFLISNNDCITIKKSEVPEKKVNDFIISKSNFSKTGKVIVENKTFLTVQKGRPYFFPNCKINDLTFRNNLQYKIVPQFTKKNNNKINQNIFVNYYDFLQFSMHGPFNKIKNDKYEFSKFFVKNKGKLYSCLIPHFSKQLRINNQSLNSHSQKFLYPSNRNFDQVKFLEVFKKRFEYLKKLEKLTEEEDLELVVVKKVIKNRRLKRTILLQNSGLISNNHRESDLSSDLKQLMFLKLEEHVLPMFNQVAKAIGLQSITENYFEQEVNSVFCKNREFIEAGKTLGLLNLEKEITGDIVQGLPRIEEILEARKKNILIKRIPLSQKKNLLTQKTSLDINFEFQKVGIAIKENEKINPHKLVKVLFNYYGLLKVFLCDRTNSFKYARLTNNYEASQRSFKKVQLFILNSVQSVYISQGVSIDDKHLEIIIKQMTTKIVITSEGDSPLLPGEVIDLYHIQYINKILTKENKKLAYYVPLLLGITKAALNNPSFISAASFQETTRVLTKAAIEGRIDWLRGLKENIIVGHLIPAGTGSLSYRNCFKKASLISQGSLVNSSQLSENSRQIS
jgi:hypothetical protein